MKKLGFWGVPLLWVGIAGLSLCTSQSGAQAQELETWLPREKEMSIRMILRSISPKEGARGSVYASPSKVDPNYYYHWVRDAALLMNEVYEAYANKQIDFGLTDKALEGVLFDHAQFSRKLQLTTNPSGGPDQNGVGEPKFYLNGSVYEDSWGRPQNDGPALRSAVLSRFAYALILQGRRTDALKLYKAESPARSVIKVDLDYVVKHWKEASFDLWEESLADHFYTRITQWRSMQVGASLAHLMGDELSSQLYHRTAAEIERSLKEFAGENYYKVSAQVKGGLTTKSSQLDVAVILGVLHTRKLSGYGSLTDPLIYKTALTLEKVFSTTYSVNRLREWKGQLLSPGIGRYPEDTYNGHRTDGLGNPWFIATQALAEYYYLLAKEVKTNGFARVSFLNRYYSSASDLKNKGDQFIARSMVHTARDFRQSEQFNRETGYMQGAVDLTWSYASFISAFRTRNTL
jgi:glucoamylase